MENACAQGTATVLGKSAKPLQVETNEPNRNRWSSCLPHEDFKVIFATEYRQGLAMDSRYYCNQLLVDTGMPATGGLEVTENLAQKFLSDKPPITDLVERHEPGHLAG